MQPKDFQEQALDAWTHYLTELANQRVKRDERVKSLAKDKVEMRPGDEDYIEPTWQALQQQGRIPRIKDRNDALQPVLYRERRNSYNKPFSHVCFKVPTGGGKTFLAALALGRMKEQTGLVLWITPSRAIYQQTWQAFATRMHPYRQALDRASAGRVKLLRKENDLSRHDLKHYLCVLPLMLQAADREDKNFLRIFRDSGHYPNFFPPQDDIDANQKLLKEHDDLDRHDLTSATPGAVKHSLYNLLKIARPIIILDEAHNAYTAKRRRRLGEFNPRHVLELSATPDPAVSNILVNIGGMALKEEQMIKLPLNIHHFNDSDWQHTLAKSKEKLDQLEEEAKLLQQESGRYIRPIMLIRVERVGKEQRTGQHIHAEDVRDYLIKQLKVPPENIRRKTAEKDEIAAEDLLSPYSSVRYILTKDALREGWDCPFAYILTLLDSTRAPLALTQMTGRVLRQPDAQLTARKDLNQSHIYCFNQDVNAAMGRIKKGLEQEGLDDAVDLVLGETPRQGQATLGGEYRTYGRRKGFEDMRIFLPRVLHRVTKRSYRLLDYDTDIFGEIAWGELLNAGPDINHVAVDRMHEETIQMDLDVVLGTPEQEQVHVPRVPTVEFFVHLLANTLPNAWSSAGFIRQAFKTLHQQGCDDRWIFEHRYNLATALRRKLECLIEQQAKSLFCQKITTGDIRFELTIDDDAYQIRQELKKLVYREDRPLVREQQLVTKSFFENMLEREFTGLEKDFAIYIDGDEAVSWWHRLAAKRDYALQGWKRNRVYPDFIVGVQPAGKNKRRILILETKGLHLAGSADTNYKEALLNTLEQVSPQAIETGTLLLKSKQQDRVNMSMRLLFSNDYQNQFAKLITPEQA